MSFLRRMLSPKRLLVFALILVIVIGVGVYREMSSSPPVKMPALQVSLFTVKTQNIPLTATALGTLMAPEGTMLKTEQAGVIKKLVFKHGTQVAAGQLLVQLDDTSAQAAYANAEANLFQARSQYQRYVNLTKEDPAALSKLQIDQVYATYLGALATAAGQKKLLDEMQIRAPFPGTVGSTTLSVGSYINVGDPVVAIVNLNDLEVVYSLPENVYAKVKVGEKVSLVADSAPGQVFEAIVTYRSPLVDAGSHAFNVRARVLHPQGLSPGMLMHVTHILESERPVLAVPTISLVAELSGFGVYQVSPEGKVTEKYVQVGAQYGDNTEIVSGLQPGDKIIVEGQSKVQPGQQVKVAGS